MSLPRKSQRCLTVFPIAVALLLFSCSIALVSQSTGDISFSIAERGGTSFSTAGGLGNAAVGYGRIQPDNGSSAAPGLAIFGFRHDGILVTEAGVPAMPAIQSGRFYAELNGPVNTGVAIANPNGESVQVSFYFTGGSSVNPSPGTMVIGANSQIAAFLNQTPFGLTGPFAGTLSFAASGPVFVTALRGFTNERSDFLITTLPVASLGAPANDTLYFPHFADGGGWATQVVLVNPTDTVISGSASFFDQGTESSPGRPVAVTIGGQQSTSFNYSIPPRGAERLSTSGTGGALRVGSVQIIPAVSSASPFGVAIFSFVAGGVTVTQAGVPTLPLGTKFRLYAETFGNFGAAEAGSIQTGVAIANPSSDPINVTFELTAFNGDPAGSPGRVTIPGRGQIAMFVNQIPGIGVIPSVFQGTLRVLTDSPSGMAVVGLRGRYNERGDFLITTTPPKTESDPAPGGEIGFAHLAEGGGWSTQFILFNGQSGPNTGKLRLVSQSGQALGLTLNTVLLSLSGTASLDSVGPYGGTVYSSQLLFKNTSAEPVTIERGEIFLDDNGGWGQSWGERLSNTTIAPSETASVAGRIVVGYPAAHVVFQLRATTASGKAQDSLFQIPIVHAGYNTPLDIPMQSQTPIYIGVQEPVETYTPSNGSKWIVIKGRLMNGTGKDVTVSQWRVIVKASNGQTVFDQDLTSSVDYTPSVLTNRNSSTTHSLVYNAHVSNDFTTGTVTQQVRLTLNGQPYLLLRNSSVSLVDVATDLQFPLIGLWRLSNAPDSSTITPPLHLFEADLNKYAFDIVRLQAANGLPFSGDPGVNESYFAWNQPIYAMEDATVLYVLNTTPDNDGNLENKSFNMNANAVIMQNAAGQYDLFFHFRQGSIVVAAGQAVTRGTLLGRVGKSGLSTAPHLHVQSYALDTTGFAKSLGQSFLNLQTIQGSHITGIPATGVYQTQ